MNNAAVRTETASEAIRYEDLRETLSIIPSGAFLCTKTAVPHLRRSGFGAMRHRPDHSRQWRTSSELRVGQVRGPVIERKTNFIMRDEQTLDAVARVRAKGRNAICQTRRALCRSVPIAGTLLLSVLAGFLADLLSVPLPYLLGPLFSTVCLSLSRACARPIPQGRSIGQVIVGLAIGAQFTYPLLLKLASLLPLIVGVTALSSLVGAVSGMLLMRLSGLDKTTAYFATVPGGVAEMANVGERYGAEQEPITVAQTMRVGLIVSIAPFLVMQFGSDGIAHQVGSTDVIAAPMLAGLLALGAAIGMVLARRQVPNGWLVGPLIGAMVVGSFGLVDGRMPDVMLVAAQVLIGTSLGAQFRPEFLTRLPRLMAASTVVVLFALATMASFAVLLAWALGLDIPTMVLSLSPAGMVEMVLTGEVLGLDAALITGFQFSRVLLVTLWVCRFHDILRRLP